MPFKNVQNHKEFSNEMRESFDKFADLSKRRFPEKVVVGLEKIVVESFEQEKYKDKTSSKWKKRKDNEDADRKLLIGKGSGKLRRSIEVEQIGSDIIVGTDMPYAAVHNEGLRSGKGKGFQMPKRQFMPQPGEQNKQLDDENQKWLDNEMDKIFG